LSSFYTDAVSFPAALVRSSVTPDWVHYVRCPLSVPPHRWHALIVPFRSQAHALDADIECPHRSTAHEWTPNNHAFDWSLMKWLFSIKMAGIGSWHVPTEIPRKHSFTFLIRGAAWFAWMPNPNKWVLVHVLIIPLFSNRHAILAFSEAIRR
jgi:hypothetical protein